MTPRHEPAGQRFTLPTTPEAVLEYRLEPGRVVFTHPIVPAANRGQGLGAQLVEAGLQWASAEGLKVVPACTYAHAYIQRHPQWQNIVA
jgi:predicted GNAT family acetyltransferase